MLLKINWIKGTSHFWPAVLLPLSPEMLHLGNLVTSLTDIECLLILFVCVIQRALRTLAQGQVSAECKECSPHHYFRYGWSFLFRNEIGV